MNHLHEIRLFDSKSKDEKMLYVTDSHLPALENDKDFDCTRLRGMVLLKVEMKPDERNVSKAIDGQVDDDGIPVAIPYPPRVVLMDSEGRLLFRLLDDFRLQNRVNNSDKKSILAPAKNLTFSYEQTKSQNTNKNVSQPQTALFPSSSKGPEITAPKEQIVLQKEDSQKLLQKYFDVKTQKYNVKVDPKHDKISEFEKSMNPIIKTFRQVIKELAQIGKDIDIDLLSFSGNSYKFEFF
jgi:hypothetical protein